MSKKNELRKQVDEAIENLMRVAPGDSSASSQNKKLVALCDAIAEHVPEFKTYKDYSLWGKENPYLHFGVFGDFLISQIQQGSDTVIKNAFDFVNDAFNDKDDEKVSVMFSTEIFEKLTSTSGTINAANEYLKNGALARFEEILAR